MLRHVVIVLAFLSACRTPQTGSNLADRNIPISQTTVSISVTHQATAPEWRVKYEFSQPVSYVLFSPFGESYKRASSWELEKPNEFVIEENSGYDIIGRQDDAPFQSFVVTFNQDKDPGASMFPMQSFSDGSSLLNSNFLTGYLYEGPAGKETATQLLPSYRLTPRPGELVSTGIATKSDQLEFQESPRSIGIYFYFGKNQPIESDGLSFIIDPAIAKVVKDLAMKSSSQAFATYQKQFGKLSFSSSVLLIHKDGLAVNSASGRASWGQFVVNIYGDGHNLNESSKEIISNAIFHEMAHFWNALAYQVRFADKDKKKLFSDIAESTYDEWIYEGGAQALSYAARKLPQKQSDLRADLLNQCKTVIGKKRVIDTSNSQDMTWAPYHCGELVQLMIVAAANKYKPGYTIYDLWKSIFSFSKDSQFDNDIFFQAVTHDVPQLTAIQIEALKKMLTTPADGLDALVATILP